MERHDDVIQHAEFRAQYLFPFPLALLRVKLVPTTVSGGEAQRPTSEMHFAPAQLSEQAFPLLSFST